VVIENASSTSNEAKRLEALRSYEILDTPPEAAFDRITKIASLVMEAPICLISLIDADRQWFKSRQGLDAIETPRNIAFCSHAIMQDDVMIVSDALEDLRFVDNPLVLGDPAIRFYAGAPLKTPSGYKIGTLCLIDRKPRKATASQIECLRTLAHLAVEEMELRIAGRKALEELRSKQRELSKMRHELEQTRRFSAMGEMSASIAHEINQPLAAVVTNAQAGLRWLETAAPDLNEVRSSLKRIVNDGYRASTVLASIRAFFKKGPSEAIPLDINEIIQEIILLLQSELESQEILVKTELGNSLPKVLAERAQLQQVIFNLLINAAEAMSTTKDRARVLRVKSVGHPSEVVVDVEDTGPGIDPNNMDRVFESLFTTKSGGMGMGLSICRSIIEAHGGRIWVTPSTPYGSNFHVMLPIAGASGES